MSHPVRLFLRAPPHVPFVQGYPGIPATPQTSTRKPPAICGTVEVRPSGAILKAKWVRVELRRHEALPASLGFPNPSKSDPSDNWEHVGGIQTLWQVPAGKEYAEIGTVDHQFVIPLPDDMPPSVDILRGGIRYELVAAVCYKKKGGVFKGDSPEIVKVSEEIRIVKHDLHSAWPLYNVPDERVFQDPARGMIMTVSRPYTAFGPTDKIVITATVRSSAPRPVKLKHFEAQLQEMITALPRASSGKDSKSKKSKAMQQPITRVRGLTTMKCLIEQTMGRGGEKTGRLELIAPDMLGASFRGGKLMEVTYEVEVKAVFEGQPEMRSKGIRYVVGAYPRPQAQEVIGDIGFFEPLCPPVPGVPVPPIKTSAPSVLSSRPSSTHSSIMPGQMQGLTSSPQPSYPGAANGYPGHMRHVSAGVPGAPMGGSPQQFLRAPVQGFPAPDNRRLSSTTISTTTTGTHLTADFVAPLPNNRAATVPNRASIAFPSPHPASGVMARTPSATYSIASSSAHGPNSTPPPGPSRQYQSELGHGDRRISSMTAATFGNWDPGLQNAMRASEPTNMSPIPARSAPGSPSRGVIPLAGSSSSTSRPADPSTWLTSEQEKLRLYNAARQKAAINQQGAGASLNRIGMEDAGISLMGGPVGADSGSGAAAEEGDDPPPPEYAPPRPIKAESGFSPVTSTSPSLEAPSTRPPNSTPGTSTPTTPLTASTPAIVQATPALSPSHPAETASAPGVPPPMRSLADEKAQMKAYYEAKDRVERMRLGSSTADAGTSRMSEPLAHNGAKAVDADIPRVAPAGSLSFAGAGSSSFAAMPAAKSPAATTFVSAAEEKEAMKRRYEEATAKVARAQVLDSPAQTVGSTATNLGPSSSTAIPIAAGPSSNASLPAPYPSAEQEKEIMRRRFEEASARVANSRFDTTPVASSSSRVPSSTAETPGSYLSAEQEKDIMRRRYEEATAKVVQRRASPPPPDLPSDHALSANVASANERSSLAGPPAHTAHGLPSQQPSTSGPGLPSSSGPAVGAASSNSTYVSAEEEKEQMRRRYQEATDRVRIAAGQEGPGPSSRAASSDVQQKNTGTTTHHDNPPPLPAKPAALADYATLLSPVVEQNRS